MLFQIFILAFLTAFLEEVVEGLEHVVDELRRG